MRGSAEYRREQDKERLGAVAPRKLTKKENTTMKKVLIMTVIMTSIAMVSCNVTRVITNESQYVQRGDTSVVIQTKTIETYDASKK